MPHFGTIIDGFRLNWDMMRTFLLVLFGICAVIQLHSQDTLNHYLFNDGTRTFWIYGKTDTVIKRIWPNGKTESIQETNGGGITGKYTRWYANGKKMWEKAMVDDREEGNAIYFDERGSRIAEFKYRKGAITDTIFLKPGIHLLMGKVTYHSTVYGGMENEDGSSNVQETSGPRQNFRMNVVRVDSGKPIQKVAEFKTDRSGFFFLNLPQGKFGFFPTHVKLEAIMPGQILPDEGASMSGSDGWRIEGNTAVSKQKVLFIHLEHVSVGYAP